MGDEVLELEEFVNIFFWLTSNFFLVFLLLFFIACLEHDHEVGSLVCVVAAEYFCAFLVQALHFR